MRKRKKTPPEDIDQKIRINEMKEEIREMGGTGFDSGEMPPEIQEEFLANVLAYEKAEFVPQLEIVKRGNNFPEAETMTDKELSAKLIKLIDVLAKRGTFLFHTNHLSDRELYVWLYRDGLSEEVPDSPMPRNGYFGLDVLGSYGEKEVNLFNRYYATKKQRAKHKKDYPDWPLPPHEDPKYDRDRFLPQAPF